MRVARRGMALPIALAAIVVFGALAGLTSLAAQSALLEARAVAADARAVQGRAVLRARAGHRLRTTPRATLVAGPQALGGGDSAIVTIALPWPWHRVALVADGAEVTSELARVHVSAIPGCAPVISPGVVVAAPGVIDPGVGCGAAVHAMPAAAFDELVDSLDHYGARVAVPETLRVSVSSAVPVLYRARRAVLVDPAVAVEGMVLAPEVNLGAASTLRGVVLARDSVHAPSGSLIVGDRFQAWSALAGSARVIPLGRWGRLDPR